jgi:dephospho-CoA kinase
MLLVGLTGNIAAGKSTVAAGFAQRGATLIDSDRAAREVVAPGTPALAAIVAHFGAGIVRPDGALDRDALGRRVFASLDARQALEAIVHPAVEQARVHAVQEARARGDTIVICDIPLLFEARLAWQFPRIVLVDAPVAQRRARLMTDRQLAPDVADARIAAQLPAVLKRARADLVIDNAGSRDALETAITAVWSMLQRWAAVAEAPAEA